MVRYNKTRNVPKVATGRMRGVKTATNLLLKNPGDLLAKLKKSKRYNDQKQENPNNAANKTRRCSNLLDILRTSGMTTFKEKAETELKANKDNTKKGKQIRGILDIIEDKPDIPKKKPHVVKAETKKSKAIEKVVT